MKSNTSILRRLGNMLIIRSGYAGDLPAEMISADEIRQSLSPDETLWKVLAACALLPEGSYYDGVNATIRDLVNEDAVDDKNAKLNKIVGLTCNVIAGNWEGIEREAMQYIISATYPSAANTEFAEVLLERIADGKHGARPRTRLFLAVMSFYYYRIAQRQAQK